MHTEPNPAQGTVGYYQNQAVCGMNINPRRWMWLKDVENRSWHESHLIQYVIMHSFLNYILSYRILLLDKLTPNYSSVNKSQSTLGLLLIKDWSLSHLVWSEPCVWFGWWCFRFKDGWKGGFIQSVILLGEELHAHYYTRFTTTLSLGWRIPRNVYYLFGELVEVKARVESYFTLERFWWKGWIPLTNVHSSTLRIKISQTASRISIIIILATTTTIISNSILLLIQARKWRRRLVYFYFLRPKKAKEQRTALPTSHTLRYAWLEFLNENYVTGNNKLGTDKWMTVVMTESRSWNISPYWNLTKFAHVYRNPTKISQNLHITHRIPLSSHIFQFLCFFSLLLGGNAYNAVKVCGWWKYKTVSYIFLLLVELRITTWFYLLLLIHLSLLQAKASERVKW